MANEVQKAKKKSGSGGCNDGCCGHDDGPDLTIELLADAGMANVSSKKEKKKKKKKKKSKPVPQQKSEPYNWSAIVIMALMVIPAVLGMIFTVRDWHAVRKKDCSALHARPTCLPRSRPFPRRP